MYDFLAQQSPPAGDVGVVPGGMFFGGGGRFFPGSAFFSGSRFFPSAFAFSRFPFFDRFPAFLPSFFPAYGYPYAYPPAYPPTYAPPAAPMMTVQITYDGGSSGPVTTTSAALEEALRILNSDPGGPVQVNVYISGNPNPIFTKSVSVATPTSAINALRAAVPAYAPPAYAPPAYAPPAYPPYGGYPYAYPYPYGQPFFGNPFGFPWMFSSFPFVGAGRRFLFGSPEEIETQGVPVPGELGAPPQYAPPIPPAGYSPSQQQYLPPQPPQYAQPYAP